MKKAKQEKKAAPAKRTKKPAGEQHIVMVLDETGSMIGRRGETVRGFDEYVANAKRDFPKARLTLVRFNSDKIDTTYKDAPIERVGPLTDYDPSYMTPLYDALGLAMKQAMGLSGKVIFVVITDGEENASAEFTRADIYKGIKVMTAKGWVFIYLGVHADAWRQSAMVGISPQHTAQPHNIAGAYSVSYRGTQSYFLGQDVDLGGSPKAKKGGSR